MAKVTFQPSGLELDIDENTTLRDAAHQLGVDVQDQCGGQGACCNCIIRIDSGAENINPKTHLEAPVFYLEDGERLSCQCRIVGDVVITPRSEVLGRSVFSNLHNKA